jgi:glycosyltransferase involved in cell wall biosynthesis
MDSKKIILVCSRLDTPGGIERAVVNTANLFAEKGHNVRILIADTNGSANSYYPVHPKVQTDHRPFSFGIGQHGNMISRKITLFKNIRQLKSYFSKNDPDIIITTEYPFSVATILSGAGKKAGIIAWEHQHFNWVKKNRFWNWLLHRTYPRLHQVVCLNNTEAGHYTQFAPVSVIPNFIEQVHPENDSVTKNQILTAGWLIHRKGTDLLLPVAKSILTSYPCLSWKLVGDGDMKEKVLAYIQQEKLEGRLIVQSPGQAAINDVYRESGIFVLASRFEAFPMVLLEALSFGIPCISFNCPSGPSVIITHEEDGLLVEPENTEQLTAAIARVLDDQLLRTRMAQNALKYVRRFDKEFIYPMWATLFTTIGKK